MSMHAIESLVEYSVITTATASPVPPLAQSICYSLYQIQNQLDCGYTVLRVRDELEKSVISPCSHRSNCPNPSVLNTEPHSFVRILSLSF